MTLDACNHGPSYEPWRSSGALGSPGDQLWWGLAPSRGLRASDLRFQNWCSILAVMIKCSMHVILLHGELYESTRRKPWLTVYRRRLVYFGPEYFSIVRSVTAVRMTTLGAPGVAWMSRTSHKRPRYDDEKFGVMMKCSMYGNLGPCILLGGLPEGSPAPGIHFPGV